MYITENDLYSKIRQSDLAQIVQAESTIIPHALTTAEGKAKAILSRRFDTAKLFDSNTPKEPILVSCICDMAVYEIIALAQPNIDLEDRRERAQGAEQYLRDLADGNHVVGWELKSAEASISPVESGGTPARGNYY